MFIYVCGKVVCINTIFSEQEKNPLNVYYVIVSHQTTSKYNVRIVPKLFREFDTQVQLKNNKHINKLNT